MIRVRMLKSAAGPNGSFPVHTTPLLDEDTALAFLEAGAAETYVPSSRREKAAAARPLVATEPVIAPTVAPVAEDPAEIERQQMFKELVEGGAAEEDARALVWPDGVERAVITPPETATGLAQRSPRKR